VPPSLAQAWLPLQLAWKRPWWEVAALPEDVDDEAAFRQEMRCAHTLLLGRLVSIAAASGGKALPPLHGMHSLGCAAAPAWRRR